MLAHPIPGHVYAWMALPHVATHCLMPPLYTYNCFAFLVDRGFDFLASLVRVVDIFPFSYA